MDNVICTGIQIVMRILNAVDNSWILDSSVGRRVASRHVDYLQQRSRLEFCLSVAICGFVSLTRNFFDVRAVQVELNIPHGTGWPFAGVRRFVGSLWNGRLSRGDRVGGWGVQVKLEVPYGTRLSGYSCLLSQHIACRHFFRFPLAFVDNRLFVGGSAKAVLPGQALCMGQ